MSLEKILSKVETAKKDSGRQNDKINVIAVSKVQPIARIKKVLNEGHRLFGENRVQESLEKWPKLIDEYGKIELHLVGSLQTNKVKDAMNLFDVIHSIDREKLIVKIANEAQNLGFCPDLFIQVNTGNETQKAGVKKEEVTKLLELAKLHSLPIIGLMCLPPIDELPSDHFKILNRIAKEHNLQRVSMGMSNDFEDAIKFGATDIRIGSAIFGPRE
jgi:pyridoxal phosphate enzyme (YggS family)